MATNKKWLTIRNERKRKSKRNKETNRKERQTKREIITSCEKQSSQERVAKNKQYLKLLTPQNKNYDA